MVKVGRSIIIQQIFETLPSKILCNEGYYNELEIIRMSRRVKVHSKYVNK